MMSFIRYVIISLRFRFGRLLLGSLLHLKWFPHLPFHPHHKGALISHSGVHDFTEEICPARHRVYAANVLPTRVSERCHIDYHV